MHGWHSCVCAGRRALWPASTVWRALSLTGALLLAVAAGADVVDLAELQVQIQSPSPEVRIKAATALGETRSEAAVSILAAALAREESVSGHGVVSPKWPMLRALGTIGGDDARDALLLILDQYLQRGPSDSRYIQNDADYNLVVTSAIFVLTQWHEEPGVVERLRRTRANRASWHRGCARRPTRGACWPRWRRRGSVRPPSVPRG
jgi:hypothetical protein